MASYYMVLHCLVLRMVLHVSVHCQDIYLLSARNLTVVARQIHMCIFVETNTEQKFGVMLRPLIKSFLRWTISQCERGERKANWGGRGGGSGGEGFSRRGLLLGAAAATGFAFLCTDANTHTG